MDQQKRWDINVARTGTVHLHHETGALGILKDGFLGTARELRAVADQPSEKIGARHRQLLDRSHAVFGWKRMEKLKSDDSFQALAEIERLIGKVYFRFSHLFLHHPRLRHFWWEMAAAKERQASILTAIKLVSQRCIGKSGASIGRAGADWLKGQLEAYLSQGTPAITAEEAFKKALEIERSEIDVISKLGGPETAGIGTGIGED
ncbi:MAG: hypothetical protein HY695_03820 [Deltaproteobacteria bacterium]|nr:hypothetical protein [Deltaproteobacteria bacterium]